MKGVENDKRGRLKEHTQGHFRTHDFQGKPYRSRLMTSVALKMPQYYGYSAMCGCTSAHPFNGTPSGSLPVAMVLVLLDYILYYYYSKKKARETQTNRGENDVTFSDVIFGYVANVTSGDVTCGNACAMV